MKELEIRRHLDRFLRIAKEKGYHIRHENLEGLGSGICEIRGKKFLFLDLSCGPDEQLESIRSSIFTRAV